MADTEDLKSSGLITHAGSTPASGTKKRRDTMRIVSMDRMKW